MSCSATPSSLLNIAGTSVPSATRAAPVSVAKSRMSAGRSSLAAASTSLRITRPSASVLSISIDMPLRAVRMSPGRYAFAETAFSTAAIMSRSRTGSPSRMISRASPIACAAPPMSFFISRMCCADLRSSPPLSKHTPLPARTSPGWLGVAPVELDDPRRMGTGAPDRVHRGKALIQQIFAHDFGESGAGFVGEHAD